MNYLKLYALFKLKIMNDPIEAFEIEKKIQEINRRDLSLDKGSVNSLTIMAGNVVSIIASFSKDQGKIISYSERSPEMFGYTDLEFQSLKSVKDLMPNIISFYHDWFITRLINEGTNRILRTYRMTVCKNKLGFLMPINIYINYFFSLQDDFCFSGLVVKLP